MSFAILRKACWMIAAINHNINSDLNASFQMIDNELYEVTKNAFEKGISDDQLSSISSFSAWKTPLEVFENICTRNKTLMNFINNTIEITSGQNFWNNTPKPVLVINAKTNIDNHTFNSQFKLILHIDLQQVQCQFNGVWYDCKGIKAVKSKSHNIFFPSILVYIRKDIKFSQDDQISIRNINFEPGPHYRRDSSADISNSSEFYSNPRSSNQNGYPSTHYIVSETVKNNILSAEKGTNLSLETQVKNLEFSDKNILYENEQSKSSQAHNSDYFAEIEEKLDEKLEKIVDHKYKGVIDQYLAKWEEKQDSIINYIEIKISDKIKAKLDAHFSFLKQELLDEMEEWNQKFKENNEKLIKDGKDDIKAIINSSHNEINPKVNGLKGKAFKPTKENLNENTVADAEKYLKEYIDIAIEKLSDELNMLKNNYQSESARPKFLEGIHRKIEKINNECNNSIGKIRIQLNSLEEKFKKNKYDERLEKLDDEIQKLKDEYKKLQELRINVDDDFKNINNEIQKYKSETSSCHLNISSQPQTAFSTNFYNSQIKTQALSQSLDARTYKRTESQVLDPQKQKNPKYTKSGLSNIGNTCYMNSVLQILASSAEFIRYIESSSDEWLNSLNSVLSLMNTNASSYQLAPKIKEFKNTISIEYSMYKGKSENDAKELFIIISSKIENSNIFTTIKNQSFTCNSCHYKTWTKDYSNLIIIPKNSGNDIKGFLNNMSMGDRKEFSGKNQLMCDRCGKLRDYVVETESIEWPNILAMHMPNCQMAYEIPDKLEIESNCYQIFGVICYYGHHFIAFTKNDENEWEKYNDSTVSKIDPDWSQLYLAFYRKLITNP